MTTPKLYMNRTDAMLLSLAFPGMEEHIQEVPQYQDWFEDEWTALIDRLNQNLKEGKPIAPVKIRDKKLTY